MATPPFLTEKAPEYISFSLYKKAYSYLISDKDVKAEIEIEIIISSLLFGKLAPKNDVFDTKYQLQDLS